MPDEKAPGDHAGGILEHTTSGPRPIGEVVAAMNPIERQAQALPARIRELAIAWSENPGLIPEGVELNVHFDDGPPWRTQPPRLRHPLVAYLEAAAGYLAPDWDVDVLEVLGGGEPVVVVKLYRGQG